jgi:hypothetical protein
MNKNNDTDFVEIGRGNQSKVIGHNNTISELGATALSIVSFCGKGGLIVFGIMSFWLYIAGYTFYWAVGIAIALTIPLTATCIYAMVQLTLNLQRIVAPPQVRNEKGQFTEIRPYNRGGKSKGAIKSVDRKEYTIIEQWGGGGDKK